MNSTSRKGHINVNTRDILPIIKKWLYSEHDIFIRELISNSTDAITKRAEISRTQNLQIPDPNIVIEVDSKSKTIVVKDNGLGMTESEVEKYLAQLAFSGAQEFVEKFKKIDGKNKQDEIIGKFGLGFYSAFMVADKVEVESLSWEQGASPIKWTCQGETEYTFSPSNLSEVGTKVTLFLNEESKDFLDGYKLRETITKYCDFMRYPILMFDVAEEARKREERVKKLKDIENKKLEAVKKGEKVPQEELPEYLNENEWKKPLNDTHPLWNQNPADLKDEDYKNFYRKLFPMDSEPLFWLHLKVDHPFDLKGILFFPKLNPSKPVHEQNIRLYARQVFVSDNVKNVIPEFLGLLKGTVDSSDIPLNVSRSALQGDPNIKKISNYIVKKVAESLKKLFKSDRQKYDKIWEDIGLFVKYGCISDSKFDELMREMVIFKNSEKKFVTLDEYSEQVPKSYQEKLKNKIIYFELGKSDQGLREQLLKESIQTIETDGYIDPHFIQHSEMKSIGKKELKFSAIDAEFERILEQENVSDKDIKIKDLFLKYLYPQNNKKVESDLSKKDDARDELESTSQEADQLIEIKNFKNQKSPAYFKYDEQMKRLQQMTRSMGSQQFEMPIKKTLVVNPGNQLIQEALRISESGQNQEIVGKICQHVKDLAQISSEGLLTGEGKNNFVLRSQELIEKLSSYVK